jgi:hypothetical protein
MSSLITLVGRAGLLAPCDHPAAPGGRQDTPGRGGADAA